MKRDKTALALLFSLAFWMVALSFESFAAQCEAVRGDTLRLHIVAASDSQYDQANKLLVRDAILAEYSGLLCGKTPEQARLFAEFLSDDMALTAKKTLAAQSCYDEVAVEVAKMYFDTMSYDSGLTLPAGEYTALRITIGEGGGRNWWCVMYPPLCIPACVEGEAGELRQRIAGLEGQPAFEVKFAAVELAQKLSAVINGIRR